jgi:hypothetical protein
MGRAPYLFHVPDDFSGKRPLFKEADAVFLARFFCEVFAQYQGEA